MAKLRTSMRLAAGIAVALSALMSATAAAEVCGPVDFKNHPKWFRAGGYCQQLMSTGSSSVGGGGGMVQVPGGGFQPYTVYVSWDPSDPTSEHVKSSTPPATGPYATQTWVSPTKVKTIGIDGSEHTWHMDPDSGVLTLLN